jgi:ribulose-phosphate 3-epimerase
MVIPAILAKSQKEFEEKIKKIAPYADTVQIDVMDGVFVPNATWADTKEIKNMRLPVRFEAHLMVKNPEAGTIEEWAKAGAFRIIFHIEATKKVGECIKLIKKYKKEIGVAINPKTSLTKIKNLLSELDYVLVMGVTPGFSGQKFQPIALEKIKQIRKLAPKVKIGVDGGVDKANAKKIITAGANYLNAASAIFKEKNIAKAIEDLI